MKRAATLIAAALISGCMSVPRQADRYFSLEAPVATVPHATGSVRVAPTSASGFYDTQDIAYSPSSGTRVYYRYGHWTERPQQYIHGHLVSRLGPGDDRSALVLRTRLDEMYHDAAQSPGTTHIAVTAQLVDAGSMAVLAQRIFKASAGAASYDAAGAVRGFTNALDALLRDIAAWVDVESTRAKSRQGYLPGGAHRAHGCA